MLKIEHSRAKSLAQRVETSRVKDDEWLKHVAVFDSKIYRLDTMTEITNQKTITIDGYSYSLRRIAFYVIHRRWPSRNFILPWE